MLANETNPYVVVARAQGILPDAPSTPREFEKLQAVRQAYLDSTDPETEARRVNVLVGLTAAPHRATPAPTRTRLQRVRAVLANMATEMAH